MQETCYVPYENLLLFWHAPLGVSRHQPLQRMVLGQVDCFIQCEAQVVGSQINFNIEIALQENGES